VSGPGAGARHRPPGRPRRGASGTNGPAGDAPAPGPGGADRALAALGLFSDDRPWLRVADVAAGLGVSDSTASRLLARLEAWAYVERQPETGLYALGPHVLTLAGVALNHSELRRAGLEEMHRLVHLLGLGANLATLRRGAVFYVGNLDGRQAPRYYTLLGRHYPLHATALGKVLLAWRGPDEVEALAGVSPAGALRRFTASTVGDVGALRAGLRVVRERGYATECEELAMGRACVAAPIRGRGGAVVAALSVSGPVQVVDLPQREGELAAAVVDAALRVSERLGFVLPSEGELYAAPARV
jgi:DNA-binding IclR family transcriptional regulator